MSVSTSVFALLILQLGLVTCFSWDIAVSEKTSLQFYYNGTLTHTEDIPSAKEIYAITYDPVDDQLLFVDNDNASHLIYSFDLSTRKIRFLVKTQSSYHLRIAYDPVTRQLFLKSGWETIIAYVINPTFTTDGGNYILSTDNFCTDIAVDSCGGYIYWVTEKEIIRARLDGTKREVLIDTTIWYRYSLTIDQQTQKMYWIEKIYSNDHNLYIESADLNGQNRKTIYTIKKETHAGSLTVTNDFIYWNGIVEGTIWQLPKNLNLTAKLLANSYNEDSDAQVIAAKYTIKDQLKGNQDCESLKSLIPKEEEEHTSDRSAVYVCQNYCLEGNCTVSAEGTPICSCKPGYTGERCEVNACQGYCLNSGICSLDEEHHPVCQCTADYDGERCAIPAVIIKCMQIVSMLKDVLKADLPPVTGTQLTCASTVV